MLGTLHPVLGGTMVGGAGKDGERGEEVGGYTGEGDLEGEDAGEAAGDREGLVQPDGAAAWGELTQPDRRGLGDGLADLKTYILIVSYIIRNTKNSHTLFLNY